MSPSIIAEILRPVSASANGASTASGSSDARGMTVASFFASASAIASACFVTHTPEAFTQDRPPLFAIDSAMTSMYCSH